MFFKYCFVFFIVIICINNANGANAKKKLGIVLRTADICPTTAHKMSKDPFVIANLTIRFTGNKSSVLDSYGNITRSFGPVSATFRVYQEQNDGSLKQIFKIEDGTCRHPLAFQLIKIFKEVVDKNCMVNKGINEIKDLDVNKFSWILTKTASSPGKFIFEIEFVNTQDNSCVYCLRLKSEVFVKK